MSKHLHFSDMERHVFSNNPSVLASCRCRHLCDNFHTGTLDFQGLTFPTRTTNKTGLNFSKGSTGQIRQYRYQHCLEACQRKILGFEFSSAYKSDFWCVHEREIYLNICLNFSGKVQTLRGGGGEVFLQYIESLEKSFHIPSLLDVVHKYWD